MSWAEQRRANRAAEADIARADADAQSERRIREQAAAAEQDRAERTAAAKQARADADVRAKRTAERRARRARAWAGLRDWVSTHRVGLLIYPLAVASAIMAVPSMAAYGTQVYGNTTGIVLPVLTELGMWAFALAVAARRRTAPEAPLWALQAGVWAFAAVGFGTNFAHGWPRGLLVAVVMGIASIAGVLAHQLVTASGLRSRADSRAGRIERAQAVKLARARTAAVRRAHAAIDRQGRARLVYPVGRYRVSRRLRSRLVESGEPAPEQAGEVEGDSGLAAEVSAWLATRDRDAPEADDGTEDRGPVATLDPRCSPEGAGDQRESRSDRASIPAPASRSLDQLRAELVEVLAADPDSIDVSSAESIRRALRCSPARARQLRDEHRHREEGSA